MYRELDNRVGNFVSVDWKELARLKRKTECEGQGPNVAPILDEILGILKSLGILTHSKENSFTLTGARVDLSPKKSYGQDPLYFSNRREAERYRDAFYENAQFKVDVRRADST